jgi:hypothetical protein
MQNVVLGRGIKKRYYKDLDIVFSLEGFLWQ